MARLHTCGFEGRDVVATGTGLDGVSRVGSAGMSVDTATVRSGAAALKLDSGAGNIATNAGFNATIALPATLYGRAYLRFTSLPGSTVPVARFVGTGNAASARLSSGGKLQLFNDVAGTQIGSDSAATLTTGVWYRIELSLLSASGTADAVELRLDGTTVASGSGLALNDATTVGFAAGWVAAPGANLVSHLDDYALNDSTGASQNSWPGDGKVVALLPTADNARASLWTGGAGGTTSLFEAVNNAPPVGVASASATNTSQVEHA